MDYGERAAISENLEAAYVALNQAFRGIWIEKALMTAGWLVSQMGDVLVPLPGREASGCIANPLDGILDV